MPDTSSTPIHALAELLSGRAQPVVVPERLAPSTIYDLRYRISVIAATFEIHAKPYGVTQRRIPAGKLKLLQFIACRPWLINMVREWSAAQHDAQFAISSYRLRRGFLGDQMHDDVVELLVARGVLVRMNAHIVSADTQLLTNLYATAVDNDLFGAERHVLQELRDIQITNAMLEGW